LSDKSPFFFGYRAIYGFERSSRLVVLVQSGPSVIFVFYSARIYTVGPWPLREMAVRGWDRGAGDSWAKYPASCAARGDALVRVADPSRKARVLSIGRAV